MTSLVPITHYFNHIKESSSKFEQKFNGSYAEIETKLVVALHNTDHHKSITNGIEKKQDKQIEAMNRRS